MRNVRDILISLIFMQFLQKNCKTRMHSSRMRPLRWLSRGGSAVCPRRGCPPSWVSAQGACPFGGLSGGVCQTLPRVYRMTDRCKNMSFNATTLRTVIIGWYHPHLAARGCRASLGHTRSATHIIVKQKTYLQSSESESITEYGRGVPVLVIPVLDSAQV